VAFHQSVPKALTELKRRFPQAPLAAFGQTVFWDEPVKSVLVPMLEAYHPGARVIVGTHDADYFGRCPGGHRQERFITCEHNDNLTRDMWAAAGEVSALFGADVVPTRGELVVAGVDFQRVLRDGRRQRKKLIEECTTAWGWRAVVESGTDRSVIWDISTRDILAPMDKLLEWALEQTLTQIEDGDSDQRRQAAQEILESFRRLAQNPESGTLTKLYQAMWPYFYQRLLGFVPGCLEVTSTFELFRFNRSTCSLPRFQLLDYFLNPETSALCRQAYSEAVEGSGIYALERFGEGALPFSLVVPGRGRGTISLDGRYLVVDTEPHIVLELPAPVNRASELAAVVEDALGPEVALVGKAVALAFMFTSEFVFVLHQEGSPYVSLTKRMARKLVEEGLAPRLHPILRVHYHTWDSLADVDACFRLSAHLAAGFGKAESSAKEFARRWRSVTKHQKKLLRVLSRTRCYRELMQLLAEEDGAGWRERVGTYVEARAELLKIQQAVAEQKRRAAALRQQIRELELSLGRLQRERGRFSRLAKGLQRQLDHQEKTGASEKELLATRRELQRCQELELPRLRGELEQARVKVKVSTAEREKTVAGYRALETGSAAREARSIRMKLEAEAETARLRLAARAIRITRSLPYTNHRPTAWWLPVVDPSGKWFQAIMQSTELSLEEMV
jgi:hypothetical protein